MKSVITTELISLWHLQLQKYNIEKEGRQGVEVWASYLAGKKDVSLQYHSLSPERLIACGIAAQDEANHFNSHAVAHNTIF